MKGLFYDWGGLNVWLFRLVNDLRGEPLDALMLWGTWLGDHSRFVPVLVIASLVALWFTRKNATGGAEWRESRLWLEVLAVFSLAYFADGWLVSWLKHSLDFPRPLAALPVDSVHVLGKPELQLSLPSGHAVFAMTVAASFWPLFQRRGRIVLVAFAVWVGLSRVNLGAHFPADVLAGYAVGATVVIAIQQMLKRCCPATTGRR